MRVAARWPALGGGAGAVAAALLLLLATLRSAKADDGKTIHVVPLRRAGNGGAHNSRSAKGSGEALLYSFKVGGQTVDLHLEQTAMSLQSLPVYANDGGQTTRIDLRSDETDSNTKFFRDPKSGAAFAVTEATVNKDGVVCHHLDGTLTINGVPHSLRPLNASASGSHGRRVKQLRSAETAVHELRRLQVPATKGDYEEGTFDWLNTGSTDGAVHRSQRARGGAPGSSARTKRAAKPSYLVNMCYVIDCFLFQRFLELESATDANRVENTMRQLRYYFAQVANTVNSRYQGIASTPWQMATKLTGLYIFTNESQCNWTETLKHTVRGQSRPVVNASEAIILFDDWILAIDPNSNYDHCVLFTGYDIYKTINGSVDYAVVGLAYVGGACSSQRVAVVEASGALNEGETHAHELGHNLAAQHDGVGNNCSSNDHFIMATTAESSTSENFYLFSNCTLASFDDFIGYLNDQSMNCLVDDNQPHFNETEFNAYALIQPGQRFSATAQCQQAFNSDWLACGGTTYGSLICTALWCHDGNSSTQGCQTVIGGARGAEGTTCGDKKWCHNGTCVRNASAPAASDSCPLGESPARVYDNYDYKCNNMPSRFCYQSYVLDKCCETCPKRLNSSFVGCEYGDRTSNCSSIPLASCYDQTVRNSCCSFCQTHKSNVSGCEWGDVYSNCASLTSEGFCYGDDTASCCRSCAMRYDSQAPSCPYGDRSDSQCPNMTAYDCDNGAASVCCGTCGRLAAAASTQQAATAARTTAAATTATTRATTSAAVSKTTAAAVAQTTARSNGSALTTTRASTLSGALTTTTRRAVSWRTPTLFVRVTYPTRVPSPPPWSAAARLRFGPPPPLLAAAVLFANAAALSLASVRCAGR